MACLNLSNGPFVNQTWSTAPNFNAGTVTINRQPDQITVQKAGLNGSINLFGEFRYVVFGDMDFVALLGVDALAGQITWRVSMVDITGNQISSTLLFSITLPSAHSPPVLSHSPGNGRLAFLWSGTGNQNEVRNMMIVRSESGQIVLPGPGTISNLVNVVSAEVTATELIIHHPNSGPNDDTRAPRPAGSLMVDPGSQDFGEAVLGGADPSLATVTRTFTLRNNGGDCLTVSAIGNDPPYTLTPASAALLPVELDPGEEVDVEVDFQPASPGNNVQGSLPVTRSPTNGDSSLECVGDARNAQAGISVSRNAIGFGTIPHPGTDTETFSISNTGEKDLDVQVPQAPANSAFSWAPTGSLALPVGGADVQVTVTFTTPGDFAAQPETITVTPTEGQARSVNLTGAGCVANAVMGLPPGAPIDFGDVERGFRTVRFIEVTNTGDGDLGFTARITAGADPAHAALFGLVLPDNDITDAPASRNYQVLPTSRCGPGATGSGRVVVAVSFFADATPDAAPYTAQLEVDNPVTGVTTTYALSATILPPVPVDAVLVLDRSGSMNDAIGARDKIEAALAAGHLFVQMLRESADDRAAIVTFNELPDDVRPIVPVAGNRAALEAALGGIAAGGNTNIAGGIIVGEDEFDDPVHPSNPQDLKKAMIVLTDGKENRCFQRGGAGPWFSITGRDAADSPAMRRPDDTPQDTEVLQPSAGIKIYGIGLGNPAQIDGAALDQLSTATGAYYDDVVELSGKDFFLLEKYFTQIFMETAGLATISDPFYTIVPGEKHEHEFDILPGDVNTMVVVYDEPQNRLPFVLKTPKGEEISGAVLAPGFGIRFHSTSTARYVEVTFPKGEPDRYAGRWKVVVAHQGWTCAGDINPPEERYEQKDEVEEELDVGAMAHAGFDLERVRKLYGELGRPGFVPNKCRESKDPVDYGVAIGAGSNLRMQPNVEPGTKYVGDPLRLNAVVSEAGLPVRGSTVRVEVESPTGVGTTVVLHDDGGHQDGEADDGDYGGVFGQTAAAGVYRLTFRAEGLQGGRPYVREAHRTKTVYDPRNPPDTPGDEDDCCKEIVRALRRLRPDRVGPRSKVGEEE